MGVLKGQFAVPPEKGIKGLTCMGSKCAINHHTDIMASEWNHSYSGNQTSDKPKSVTPDEDSSD